MKKYAFLAVVAAFLIGVFLAWQHQSLPTFPIVEPQEAATTSVPSVIIPPPDTQPALSSSPNETIIDTSIQKQGVVVVANVYAAVPETKDWFLYDVVYSSAKHKLFFGTGNFGDGPIHQLYSFDTVTKEFRKLTEAYKANDGWRGPEKASISPDGFQFLSIEKDQLFLVNMDTDSVQLLKKLPAGETFVKTNQNFGGIDEGENSWLSNSKIQYSIFSAADDGHGNHVFLRSEKLDL